LIKEVVSLGKNHVVMEDLSVFGKMFSKTEEFEGFKYGRLSSILNLISLKDYVKSIAYKNNITITFIQPHYTSQQCSKCGNIDENNRKSQETFKCTKCGFEINADFNASLNISNRVLSDVLKNELLKLNCYNELIPKSLNKYKIKDVLLTHST